jgi:DNA damage-binding protein 1
MAMLSSWAPSGALAGKHITVAAADGRQVLLALSGGAVVLLRWAAAGAGGAPQLQLAGQATMPHEVSCLHLSALELPASLRAGSDGTLSGGGSMDVEGDEAAAAAANAAPVAAVGLWTDTTVRLLSLATPALPELSSVTLGGDIQSRSVLLVALEGLHYLFASQGDGTLFNFKLRLTTHAADAASSSSAASVAASAFGLEVRERKQVTLGTQPVTLAAFANKGATHVFAACDRPTVLSSSGRKLLYSNVNVGAVTYMAPFDSPSLPDCLALASPEALTLGTVDDIQKLHIRTVPLGEQPRRVAHLRRSKTLAVSVEALTAASGVLGEGGDGAASERAGAAGPAVGLSEAAFIRLFDDASFDRLASFQLDPHEIVLALAAVRLPTSAGAAGPGRSPTLTPPRAMPARAAGTLARPLASCWRWARPI